jgi:hypothetical protein
MSHFEKNVSGPLNLVSPSSVELRTWLLKTCNRFKNVRSNRFPLSVIYIELKSTTISNRKLRLDVLHNLSCFNKYIFRCPERTKQGNLNGANFHLHILRWSAIMKIKEIAQILSNFFTVRKSYWSILAKKWVGLHFGRLFRKLIWSPWWECTSGGMAAFLQFPSF